MIYVNPSNHITLHPTANSITTYDISMPGALTQKVCKLTNYHLIIIIIHDYITTTHCHASLTLRMMPTCALRSPFLQLVLHI